MICLDDEMLIEVVVGDGMSVIESLVVDSFKDLVASFCCFSFRQKRPLSNFWQIT
jgi:hypothetical protein